VMRNDITSRRRQKGRTVRGDPAYRKASLKKGRKACLPENHNLTTHHQKAGDQQCASCSSIAKKHDANPVNSEKIQQKKKASLTQIPIQNKQKRSNWKKKKKSDPQISLKKRSFCIAGRGFAFLRAPSKHRKSGGRVRK